MGHNVEAYVDDIVVKSKLETDHVVDLQETFDSQRAAGVRLNPKKCLFGGKAGKLLRYLVSQRGIEANPGKIRAITEMSPPTNTKEVQHLASLLAALSSFPAKSAEHNLPFFKVLRGSEPFKWTPECQAAFEALKAHLSDLETLAIPSLGKGPSCTYPPLPPLSVLP